MIAAVDLVQNKKENCHHDHMPFNLKAIENIVFSGSELRGFCILERPGYFRLLSIMAILLLL